MTQDKFKTAQGVFDHFTIETLHKLEADGFFVVDTLQPLFIGKEANVFIGEGSKGRLIVKIYRLENVEFMKMYEYIRLDTRMQNIKRRRRDIIFAWVRREYKNLLKAREFQVNVPTPYTVRNNVLVMEMIGDPANKLKDVIPKNPKKFYADTIKEMKKLHKAGLVHADLSQFNILNLDEKPVLIDFSQTTTIDSPRAKDYLERDLLNVNTFFKKLGQEELKTLEDFR